MRVTLTIRHLTSYVLLIRIVVDVILTSYLTLFSFSALHTIITNYITCDGMTVIYNSFFTKKVKVLLDFEIDVLVL